MVTIWMELPDTNVPIRLCDMVKRSWDPYGDERCHCPVADVAMQIEMMKANDQMQICDMVEQWKDESQWLDAGGGSAAGNGQRRPALAVVPPWDPCR